MGSVLYKMQHYIQQAIDTLRKIEASFEAVSDLSFGPTEVPDIPEIITIN